MRDTHYVILGKQFPLCFLQWQKVMWCVSRLSCILQTFLTYFKIS